MFRRSCPAPPDDLLDRYPQIPGQGPSVSTTRRDNYPGIRRQGQSCFRDWLRRIHPRTPKPSSTWTLRHARITKKRVRGLHTYPQESCGLVRDSKNAHRSGCGKRERRCRDEVLDHEPAPLYPVIWAQTMALPCHHHRRSSRTYDGSMIQLHSYTEYILFENEPQQE